MARAVVVAAALAFVLLRDSGGGGLSTVSPNSVGVVDPGSNKLVAEVPVGIDPESVTVGEGAVWVANVDDETVSRIDPATRERGRTIDVGDYPSDIVVAGGTVWVALGALAELTRIDPAQDQAATPIPALGPGVSVRRAAREPRGGRRGRVVRLPGRGPGSHRHPDGHRSASRPGGRVC